MKISGATNVSSLLGNDMLPLARSGSANAYNVTATQIATFTNASLSSGAYGNVGRNLLHNSQFAVASRGSGSFGGTTAGWTYTADRWKIILGAAGDSDTATLGTLTDADRAGIGDEAATHTLNNTFTGGSGATNFVQMAQAIEGVRRLGGKTVTVSFWAAAGTALRFGVGFAQVFGTGGSPSTQVNLNGQSVALTTAWGRYSLTFTLPSVAGKTLGTNGDDQTTLTLWYSAGSGGATQSGSVGVQSGSVNLWGVQVEIGSAATPLEKLDIRIDISNCLRFYQVGLIYVSSYQAAGQTIGYSTNFFVPMRGVPTLAFAGQVYFNASGLTALFVGNGGFVATATATALGVVSFQSNFTASADL